MQLVVLGLNHKTAPVDVRECYVFPEDKIKHVMQHLHEYDGINECVVLSTCNRSELYAVVEEEESAYPILKEMFMCMAAFPTEWEDFLFFHTGEDCIRHLFQVSAGLDSMIIGEGQILNQVKKAYSLSRQFRATSTVLNTLFNRAIAVGKRVRTETRIAYNAVSVSYAAVELAKKALGNLSASNVLVLGAGEMSELTVRHLVENGVQKVYVSNRSLQRAEELAQRFRGEAVPFYEFSNCAQKVDIIITSTGAPHYIVTAWDAARMMPARQGRPLIFIDIAVPRDVEPEVAAVSGAVLYNIDDLEAVVESNIRGREMEARAASVIIEEAIRELEEKFRYLSFQPTMALLSNKAETIRQREVKRALTKLSDITPEERRVLENMSKMIIRKMLRDPMIQINKSAGTEREEQLLDTVQSLFNLEQLGGDAKSENQARHRYAR